MDEVEVVRAWSGKWHIYDMELESAKPIPASTYGTRIPKPERPRCLARCGERIMYRERKVINSLSELLRQPRCHNCQSILWAKFNVR